jgi:hypothetical protein
MFHCGKKSRCSFQHCQKRIPGLERLSREEKENIRVGETGIDKTSAG